MIFAHKEKDLLSKCYSEDIKPSFFPSKQRKGIFYMTLPAIKELLKTRYLTKTHYLITLDLKAKFKIKPQHRDNNVALPLSPTNCIAYPYLCSFTRRCKYTTN